MHIAQEHFHSLKQSQQTISYIAFIRKHIHFFILLPHQQILVDSPDETIPDEDDERFEETQEADEANELEDLDDIPEALVALVGLDAECCEGIL